MRASDADREEIVARLRKAATEGRIGAEELEQRVTAGLTARTYAELDAVVADLPRQVGYRPSRNVRRRSAGGWALAAVRANPLLLLFAIPVVAVTAAMVVAATVMWAVLMIVVMVLGGRPRGPRAPWVYTRCRLPSRRPRSYWA
jgi:hypothetical protein